MVDFQRKVVPYFLQLNAFRVPIFLHAVLESLHPPHRTEVGSQADEQAVILTYLLLFIVMRFNRRFFVKVTFEYDKFSGAQDCKFADRLVPAKV
jgi:hypothetical protein